MATNLKTQIILPVLDGDWRNVDVSASLRGRAIPEADWHVLRIAAIQAALAAVANDCGRRTLVHRDIERLLSLARGEAAEFERRMNPQPIKYADPNEAYQGKGRLGGTWTGD